MNSALAIQQDGSWSRERIELIKRTIIPQGCGDDDLALFLEVCRRTGLDPLLKQAYMIERSANVDGRWVKKYEFQAAEGGMAAIVDTFSDFRGMKAAAVFSKDTIEIDESAGVVHHKYNPAGDRGELVGAWAHASRDGRHIPITYLPLESRVQKTKDGRPTKFWGTMPAGMIVKCARAEQYRLAYPNVFGGVYIREEMPEDETGPALITAREVISKPGAAIKVERLVIGDEAKTGLTVPLKSLPGPAAGEPPDDVVLPTLPAKKADADFEFDDGDMEIDSILVSAKTPAETNRALSKIRVRPPAKQLYWKLRFQTRVNALKEAK